ncbi:MAG TPA: ATP-dependent helicase C-terminal domain-containing protein, partial [Devosia sp.]|nr:ATP-dependent helicase C-terminal domain-containing protein [Devosia sp.]
GRIRAAAALVRDDIEMLLASHIATETVLYWDEAAAAVRARRRRTCGALVLADDPVPVPPGEAAARLLAEHAVDRLPWSREQRALVERAQFLGRPIVVAPGDLLTGLHGKTALAELAPADLDPLIPHALRAEIERQLPSHFTAPTGTRVPIDYSTDSGPSIEIRVQELFGLDRHPTLAGGRLPLTLVLLSPAHRPIQTTRDLPGFWRGSWKDVAREMRGRYPRHPWPDDPASATATSRAKPRAS